jgi:TonB family protein
METFALYLLKSVTWLSGFTVVYIIFLRNERFFTLNRFFLLSGIFASFLLPLFSIRYTVFLNMPEAEQAEGSVVSSIDKISGFGTIDTGLMLILLYLSGIIFIGFMAIRQSRSVIRSISKAVTVSSSPVKLIRTSDYSASFSFFSWVFVNPSVTDIEMREIMNHELVHIRQKHWVDLVFAGMLCMLQWFNPIVWIYSRIIKQNHEYIADEVALQRTTDPAVYRATLLNQITGSQVVTLANSFNYSLNKKRFEMMKNIITSPYRKMKVLLILPMFAIILYAFAKPEYRYDIGIQTDSNQKVSLQEKTVKGTVLGNETGKPLEKATIIVTGTTTGTSTDANGRFTIGNIPEGRALAITYVGYKSKVIKPQFSSEMTIRMDLDTISSERFVNQSVPPPPPPPPPPPVEAATSKSTGDKPVKDTFIVVEELPQYNGGINALNSWIYANLKYPEEAYKKKITGKVYVTFLITSTGKVKNAEVREPVNPLLDAEAKRLISSMPDWKPGTQSGKPVDVYYRVPVEFKLK